MNIKCLTLGPFQTNTYIVYQDQSCIIIDPNGKLESVLKAIADYKLEAILLTHGHFDHIGLVDQLIEKYHCPCFINQNDYDLISSIEHNNLAGFHATIKSDTNDLKEGALKIGDFDIEIIETPGHTQGSVCIIIGDYMFTGDTLFKGSIGRTDLYGGNYRQLLDSLAYLKTIQKNYHVLPGHEAATTLFDEIKYNSYMR